METLFAGLWDYFCNCGFISKIFIVMLSAGTGTFICAKCKRKITYSCDNDQINIYDE